VGAHLRTTAERLDVRVGSRALVAGGVRHPVAGRRVALQRRSGAGWTTVARDRTDARGAFRLRFTPRAAERAAVRLRVAGDAVNATTHRQVGRLLAFRTAVASWYGPGFYGSRTACGQTFHAGLMGVAHKTLPCGTRLTFRHRGRIAHARVVDRGPFIAGREFDLGVAVKQRLGFGSGGAVEVAHSG
jgi:rare lipoprotein A (peptidoglycan hydrolase)